MKTFIVFAIIQISYFTSGEIHLEHVPDFDIADFSAIKEKCDKAGAADAYDNLKALKDSFRACITQFATFAAVDEIKEAEKNGSMDNVFEKYCARRSRLAVCVESFINNLRLCLYSEENEALNKTLDALKQLGDSICYRYRDRIAMFIEEGGLDCVSNNMDGIKNCINSTFKIQPSTVHFNVLLNLLTNTDKCKDFGKLRNCIVDEMTKCKESTPSGIVHILFTYIKGEVCRITTKRQILVDKIWQSSVEFLYYYLCGAPEMKKHVLNIFKEKCSQNGPEASYESFRSTFERSTECFRNTMRDEPIFETPSTYYKENMDWCFSELIEKSEACLPEDEKYWPKYYMKSMLNFFDFVFHLLSLARFGNRFLNCPGNVVDKELAKCYEVPRITNFRKEIICGKLTTMKTCVSEQIHKMCFPDFMIQNSINHLVNSLNEPCDDDE